MPEHAHDPEMTDLEGALGALRPAAARLDRDRLMFEAGRRSAAAPAHFRWAWPAVAASLAAVSLGQAAALNRRSEPTVVERIIFVPRPAAPAEPARATVLKVRNAADSDDRRFEPPPDNRYLQISRQVERYGLDGLPDPTPLLTLSAEGEIPAGFSPNAPDVLRRYKLDKVLDLGGPL
jgi:hypothetical protein